MRARYATSRARERSARVSTHNSSQRLISGTAATLPACNIDGNTPTPPPPVPDQEEPMPMAITGAQRCKNCCARQRGNSLANLGIASPSDTAHLARDRLPAASVRGRAGTIRRRLQSTSCMYLPPPAPLQHLRRYHHPRLLPRRCDMNPQLLTKSSSLSPFQRASARTSFQVTSSRCSASGVQRFIGCLSINALTPCSISASRHSSTAASARSW